MGPNVKKLIAHKTSLLMVPAGTKSPIQTAITNLERVCDFTKEASLWVNQCLAAVKATKDNPYGDDDEAIAGEILKQIELRKK